METLLWLPEGCVNLSLSLSLFLYPSHFCVYTCVCVFSCVCVCEELWQTKLDSVGGVNSITFFFLFLPHISESDSAQVLRPIK